MTSQSEVPSREHPTMATMAPERSGGARSEESISRAGTALMAPTTSKVPSKAWESGTQGACIKGSAAAAEVAAKGAVGGGSDHLSDAPRPPPDLHTRPPSKGTQGVPSPLMEAIQAQREWAKLKRDVLTQLLAAVPFFGTLSAARREEVAQLVEIETHSEGAILCREGDYGGRFYILYEGGLDVQQFAGREHDGQPKYQLIGCVMHGDDRPWLGEVGLFIPTKVRQGTAVIRRGGARLLSMAPSNFETFVALCPDFRGWINKSHEQVERAGAEHGSGTTREEAERAERAAITHVSVGVQWISSAKLGGLGQEVDGDRCLFAERWERMVSQLLFQDESYTKHVPTVSLDVKDYATALRTTSGGIHGAVFPTAAEERRANAAKRQFRLPGRGPRERNRERLGDGRM